ncbi:MAG: KUP/HAK/KT family potassium transporter, partial [Oryzihumus sp.]
WLCVVLPALVLAYLGETAEVLAHPGAAADPFYAVVPGWATIPVLVVATLATIIASEAVIAGAFTVLHQAGGLGLFPFLRTRHTSPDEGGQIFVPAANWALAVAVLGVVALFRSSDRLSAAYGVAVSVTILITVTLYLVLDRVRHGRVTVKQVAGAAMFLVMLAFVAASVPKLRSGGWLPAGIGAVLFVVMTTWWSGQRRLRAAESQQECSGADLLQEVGRDDHLHRTPGSAVFLTEDSRVAPLALRTVVDRQHVLPRRVILLSWRVEDKPEAPAHEAAIRTTRFGAQGAGMTGVDVALGYRDRLDVAHVLDAARRKDPDALEGVEPDSIVYYVSDARPRLSRHGGMARWRQRLFLLLHRLATDRVDQLALPRHRTIVVGRELDL